MKVVKNGGNLGGHYLLTNDDRKIHIPSGHLGDFAEAVENAMSSEKKASFGEYYGNGQVEVEGSSPGFWVREHRVNLTSIRGSYYLSDRSASLNRTEARQAVNAVYSFIENKALKRGYIKQMKELGNILD